MVSHYSMVIQWSDGDGAYVVSFPEFPSAHTHGDSYEEAARRGREVLDLLQECYTEAHHPLPEPVGFELVTA
ncbi:MAG: type II toxin-antitoxin system HicB family antitoxin [Anaerolineae bacterium]|jgi:predicted RNase H-like HicB family nuclease|nr:type II toxin-antitoxin system HicB family antitoxin [Anaerolineae bacterium]